jgi:hypothetical protein
VQRFYDIGALVFYLKAIPWQVPNFDIKTHIIGLYNIHQIIQSKGFFDVEQHRFIIKAEAKINSVSESHIKNRISNWRSDFYM